MMISGILGVTLARGGSKGLPKKNIRLCAGKPLLNWTIEAAKESNFLDKYLVCTEDPEIAAVARKAGAGVLIRPDELAADNVNRWDVLKWVIRQYPCCVVVLLQATSPIRRPGLIDECINEFLCRNYDSLATGFWYDGPYPKNKGVNRQEAPRDFFDDGSVYIWKSELIEKYPQQESGRWYGFKELTKPENIDINNEFDLFIAEKVLNEYPICPT